MNLDRLKADLVREEGLRLKPYTDTVGKLTIGVGRNLTDKGISREEAMAMLDADVAEVVTALSALPWFGGLNDVRQRVMVDMGFNLGIFGLLAFHRTLASIARGDYVIAAKEMLDSQWAHQVGDRATRLAQMMRTGVDQPF